MNYKVEEISKHLNKLVAFLEPVHSLANSHFASLFSENLWIKQIPVNIQKELSNANSLNDFIHIYPEIIKNNCPVEFANRHPNLVLFIENSVNISIANDKVCSKLLVDLENSVLTEGYHAGHDFFLEEFMSKKKLHEVKKSSKIIAALSKLTNSSHIVDVGGGKGYLSSVLALHHSFKVLGLDSSEVTTCGALKRSEKLAKLWSGGNFEKATNSENNQIINNKTKENFIKKYYKQVITFVNPCTNILNLLKENFKEEIKGITIAGLHTCGDLAPTCLKMFLHNEEVKAILNIGCCYHLINEEFLSSDMSEDNNNIKQLENYGFPLSDFLRRKNYTLGRNARMLAAHSLERIISQTELEFSQTSIFYRAILETMLKNYPGKARVGRLAKKCKNFHEYMYKALKKLDINIQISENDLEKIYNSYQDKKPLLKAFFFLRVTLAPIIESIILLDRILYLIESGINKAYLVRLFDLDISPRGFGVIAWKDCKKK